ncbi:MAG TPA: VOC family protein [Micropepsaceae bacterium]|nr:VOC family protein [Micropepsaceae bacterium]
MAVSRISAFSLTSAAPDTLEAFYREAFGFERVNGRRRIGDDLEQVIGCGPGCATLLRLGEQKLELLTFDEAGRPYPPDVPGNDLRFQHFAIVVADMHTAYGRLLECRGWTPITTPAPQQLPASAGGVSAFKFRDPEGHPLELLAFPGGKIPHAWQWHRQHSDCLGIDHTAISVADTSVSVKFYRDLAGFKISATSLNTGIEQQRLDAVEKPVVEVTALSLAGQPPHLELLCYRKPAPCRPDVRPACNDIAATRIVITTERQDGNCPKLVHDPDGHAVLLCESRASQSVK